MGNKDMATTFWLWPEFIDARCDSIMEPRALEVRLNLTFECGNEVETVQALEPATPMYYYRNSMTGSHAFVSNAQDHFDVTSSAP